MIVLITGVAGFVGSNLAKKLLEENCTVIGIDNLSYGYLSNLKAIEKNPKFTFILGDIANPLILKDHKADVIVHLASQKIPRYTNALRTLDENYLMLRNVVHKCILDKSKIVFASTSDVYGKNPNVPFSEESDLVLGPTTVKRWAYASSKLYGEQYIIANNDEYGLDYTIMRFFGSYGPNQNTTWWGGPQAVFIQNFLEKKPIEIHGDGTQTRTFTYIEDTIQGIVKCVLDKRSNNSIYNIATNPTEEITIVELAKLIWKLMGNEESSVPLSFIPYSTFGKYEDVLRRVPDITKIKTELDFNPKYSLAEGLAKTIKWQQELFNQK
ncbi:MAG: NAD-dependent epimerase/dehydratase family protein [Bacteroidetes bacterium]|nr:NAD-dependent epimerase/dehydratase family protein [Bacteroidota bacterium]